MKSRILRETIEGVQVTIGSEHPYPAVLEGGSWQEGTVVIDGTAYKLIFNNGYFDLSGYSKEQETLFCQAVTVQENPVLFGSGMCFTAHIVSTEPLNIDDFEVVSGSRAWALPGNMASSYSLQQIFWGQCSLWTTDTTVNSIRPAATSTWGVGASTAREKLYYAVAYAFPPGTPHQIFIPDTSFVLPVIIDTEPDLEYIMRLKRSMELSE